jgi:hypothetical protein
VMHGHGRRAAGLERPDGLVDEQVHVVLAGGEAVRRERRSRCWWPGR